MNVASPRDKVYANSSSIGFKHRPQFHRQHERENASAAGSALHADRAAVHLQETLDQREAETCALRTLRRALHLAELFENHLVIFRIDADALIGNRHLNRIAMNRRLVALQRARGDAD